MLRRVFAVTGMQLRIALSAVWAVLLATTNGGAAPAVPLEENLRVLQEAAGRVRVELPEENPEARAAAEALLRVYQSEGFQQRVEEQRRKLAGALPGREENAAEPDEAEREGRSGAFYLFVSSSMPVETLRTYAADLARLKSPRIAMVLRGFVGGARKIGPTAAFIADVLKADADCDPGREQCAMVGVPFIVDPLLFRRAEIEQVPALAWLPGEKEEPLVVCGDARIGYLLDYLERESTKLGF